MKKLLHPDISGLESYRICISGVEENDLKIRLEACSYNINEKMKEYIKQANVGSLFSIAPLKYEKNKDPNVIGNVLKSEFIKLYDYYMVQKKPARDIYDIIMVAANEKCPFCGIGQPKTLDHYLPKANYPQFSVFPLNLVPACRDCNTGKKNALATSANEQVLHPYFDDDCYFLDQWIVAQVIQSEPCSIEFHVDPPYGWQKVQKERVKKHFEDFDLAKRYSIQAAEELSILVDQRTKILRDLTPESFKEVLQSIANSATFFVNHWRKIMYQSLAKDEWFYTKQF